jgi:hypothetical protein
MVFSNSRGERFKIMPSPPPEAGLELDHDCHHPPGDLGRDYRQKDKIGQVAPFKVKDAMAAISWDGVSGNIAFDAHHNPVKSAVVVSIKDEKKEFVTSVAP